MCDVWVHVWTKQVAVGGIRSKRVMTFHISDWRETRRIQTTRRRIIYTAHFQEAGNSVYKGWWRNHQINSWKSRQAHPPSSVSCKQTAVISDSVFFASFLASYMLYPSATPHLNQTSSRWERVWHGQSPVMGYICEKVTPNHVQTWISRQSLGSTWENVL